MFASTRSRRNANKRRRRSSLSSVRPPLANVTSTNKKQKIQKKKTTPKVTPKRKEIVESETLSVKQTTPESTGTPMSQVSDLSDFNSPENNPTEDRRESRRNTASSTDIATLIDDLEAEDTEEMEDDENLDSSMGEASPKMMPASIKKAKKKRRRRSSRRNTASPGNVAALIDALQDSEDDSDDDIATPKVPKHRSQTPLKSILSVKSKPTTNSLLDMFSGKKKTKTTGKKKKKGVVFGSPQAAMFEKNKPANQMTPMPKAVTSQLFSMSELKHIQEDEEEEEKERDEITTKNDTILAGVDEMDSDDSSDRRSSLSDVAQKLEMTFDEEEDEEEEKEEIVMMPRRSPRIAKIRQSPRASGAKRRRLETYEDKENSAAVAPLPRRSPRLQRTRQQDTSMNTSIEQIKSLAPLPSPAATAKTNKSTKRRRSSLSASFDVKLDDDDESDVLSSPVMSAEKKKPLPRRSPRLAASKKRRTSVEAWSEVAAAADDARRMVSEEHEDDDVTKEIPSLSELYTETPPPPPMPPKSASSSKRRSSKRKISLSSDKTQEVGSLSQLLSDEDQEADDVTKEIVTHHHNNTAEIGSLSALLKDEDAEEDDVTQEIPSNLVAQIQKEQEEVTNKTAEIGSLSALLNDEDGADDDDDDVTQEIPSNLVAQVQKEQQEEVTNKTAEIGSLSALLNDEDGADDVTQEIPSGLVAQVQKEQQEEEITNKTAEIGSLSALLNDENEADGDDVTQEIPSHVVEEQVQQQNESVTDRTATLSQLLNEDDDDVENEDVTLAIPSTVSDSTSSSKIDVSNVDPEIQKMIASSVSSEASCVANAAAEFTENAVMESMNELLMLLAIELTIRDACEAALDAAERAQESVALAANLSAWQIAATAAADASTFCAEMEAYVQSAEERLNAIEDTGMSLNEALTKAGITSFRCESIMNSSCTDDDVTRELGARALDVHVHAAAGPRSGVLKWACSELGSENEEMLNMRKEVEESFQNDPPSLLRKLARCEAANQFEKADELHERIRLLRRLAEAEALSAWSEWETMLTESCIKSYCNEIERLESDDQNLQTMCSKLEKAHSFAVEYEAEIRTKYEHDKTMRNVMRTLRSAEKTQVRAVTINAAEEAAEKALLARKATLEAELKYLITAVKEQNVEQVRLSAEIGTRRRKITMAERETESECRNMERDNRRARELTTETETTCRRLRVKCDSDRARDGEFSRVLDTTRIAARDGRGGWHFESSSTFVWYLPCEIAVKISFSKQEENIENIEVQFDAKTKTVDGRFFEKLVREINIQDRISQAKTMSQLFHSLQDVGARFGRIQALHRDIHYLREQSDVALYLNCSSGAVVKIVMSDTRSFRRMSLCLKLRNSVVTSPPELKAGTCFGFDIEGEELNASVMQHWRAASSGLFSLRELCGAMRVVFSV